MSERFERCLAHVLRHEGGYVDHPLDPGGATNMGITRKALAQWRGVTPFTQLPKSEVQALTQGEAAAICEDRYWRCSTTRSIQGRTGPSKRCKQ
jgi:lysozyme family protein